MVTFQAVRAVLVVSLGILSTSKYLLVELDDVNNDDDYIGPKIELAMPEFRSELPPSAIEGKFYT